MGKVIRNFFVEGEFDGYTNRRSKQRWGTGPGAEDGFELVIRALHRGQSVEAVRVKGTAKGGKLLLTVSEVLLPDQAAGRLAGNFRPPVVFALEFERGKPNPRFWRSPQRRREVEG